MLLFTTFAGSLTYLYGVNDFSSFSKLEKQQKLQAKPKYAKKAELEKVRVV